MATNEELLKTAAATTTPTTTTATTTPATAYTVGGNYTPDTSLYSSADTNALSGLMATNGTNAVYNKAALEAYDRQLAAYKSALQNSYDAQAAANRAQAKKLASQYNAARNDVYTNARLNVIGNNERLAAKGLAGNLYDYARSGMSETSRIGQNVAMRKNLAAQTLAENQANDALDLALLNAQKEADTNYANKAAEIEGAKIPYFSALSEILAQAAANLASASSGGGGGGYSYTPVTSSSKKSSSSSGSSGSSGWDAYSIYKAAADANNGNYNAGYKALEANKSAFTNAGASSKAVNTALTVLHDQASGVNRTAQIKAGLAAAAAAKAKK